MQTWQPTNQGEVKVRRSIPDARKQEQADTRMHHKQSATIPDYEGWLDEAEHAETEEEDEVEEEEEATENAESDA